MSKIKAPKLFSVGGRDFVVKYEKEIHSDDGIHGLIIYKDGVVKIKEGLEAGYIPLVFWHEAVHAILMTMSHQLASDEIFVDTFATLLVQVLKTSE